MAGRLELGTRHRVHTCICRKHDNTSRALLAASGEPLRLQVAAFGTPLINGRQRWEGRAAIPLGGKVAFGVYERCVSGDTPPSQQGGRAWSDAPAPASSEWSEFYRVSRARPASDADPRYRERGEASAPLAWPVVFMPISPCTERSQRWASGLTAPSRPRRAPRRDAGRRRALRRRSRGAWR